MYFFSTEEKERSGEECEDKDSDKRYNFLLCQNLYFAKFRNLRIYESLKTL